MVNLALSGKQSRSWYTCGGVLSPLSLAGDGDAQLRIPAPLPVYISSHSRVTSLPVGRKSLPFWPLLFTFYTFFSMDWHLHNTKTSIPYSMQYFQCRPIWVEWIIYLQLQDPAILGFLAGQYPLVLHHCRSKINWAQGKRESRKT